VNERWSGRNELSGGGRQVSVYSSHLLSSFVSFCIDLILCTSRLYLALAICILTLDQPLSVMFNLESMLE